MGNVTKLHLTGSIKESSQWQKPVTKEMGCFCVYSPRRASTKGEDGCSSPFCRARTVHPPQHTSCVANSYERVTFPQNEAYLPWKYPWNEETGQHTHLWRAPGRSQVPMDTDTRRIRKTQEHPGFRRPREKCFSGAFRPFRLLFFLFGLP